MLYINKTVNLLEETFWAWKVGGWFGWDIFQAGCSLARLLHQGFCRARTEHSAEGNLYWISVFCTPFWFGLGKSYTWIFWRCWCLNAFIVFVCVYEFFTCMYVLHGDVSCMNRPEESTESSGTWTTDHCEPLCVWWKLNPIYL